MLHILLLILKIIGIILGAVISIVLLCLCFALFVPVRYKIEAQKTAVQDGPPVEVQVKVTWLLHLVNIRLHYATNLQLRARVFLFTVFRLPKEKKSGQEKNKRKRRTKPGRNAKENNGVNDVKEKEGAERKSEAEEKKGAGEKADTGKREDAKIKTDTGKDESAIMAENAITEDSLKEDGEGSEKKSRIKFSLKGLAAKICRFFQNIWYTIIGICDKIKKIWENIEYYLNVLQSDAFRQSFALCKNELGKVFSYIKPRKFQADLIIGMGEPASTAQILAYYGMLYPFIGNNVNIVPDFENKRMEGNVLIKGKIKLFTFLRAALHIYFNKDIKRLLKLFKKEDV